MSYQVFVDGEDAGDVATISGWADFARWLEQRDSAVLRQLAEYGWTARLPQLADDLKGAVKSGSPSEDQRHIAEALIDAVEKNEDGEVLAVSSGFEEGEEE